MPYIKKEFIASRLIPQVNIEELIGRYVELKRAGNDYKCCCPFHQEKTPSFHVVPEKQFFHCFGCGASGNAIDFVMRYKNLSFPDAVREVAAFANLEIEYEEGHGKRGGDGAQGDDLAPSYELIDRVAQFFANELRRPENQGALSYFTQKRGLSMDTITRLRLGYAPNDWNYALRLARSREEEDLLVSLGLVKESDGRRYSFFRDRVMIPILNRAGKIVAFGGRVLGDGTPKYINSPEGPIFHKRSELFGLHECLLDHPRNHADRIVVVEGYMDVISLRQAGFDSAVASLGTATTAEQFRLMFRYTSLVVCCYDGDSAGRKAAWRALENVTPVLNDKVQVKFAFLPFENGQKEDPDSYVRAHGLGGFTALLDRAMDYSEFLIDHTLHEHPIGDASHKQAFLRECLAHISRIGIPALRLVTLEILGKVAGMSPELLATELSDPPPGRGPRGQGAAAEEQAAPQATRDRLLSTPMRRLMAFAIQQPETVARCADALRVGDFLMVIGRLGVAGHAQCRELITGITGSEVPVSTASILEQGRGTSAEGYLRKLAGAPIMPSLHGEPTPAQRVAYLGQLLGEVVAEALRARAREIAVSGDSGAIGLATRIRSGLLGDPGQV
ncbi:MAG: DNA primase [Succinivibrionaceae bacterium]|nr:DNA primase [Succinivibrionaceae bacterium]